MRIRVHAVQRKMTMKEADILCYYLEQHQENGGHGEAVNAGIRNATGLYFKVAIPKWWLCNCQYWYNNHEERSAKNEYVRQNTIFKKNERNITRGTC